MRSAVDRWPVWKRLPFRILLCYLSLCCLDFFGDVISFCIFLATHHSAFPTSFTTLLWRYVVPWVGRHVLRLASVPVTPNGSGDTLYDWVLVFTEVAIACIATGVWTVLDESRRRDVALYRWLRLAVRTALAAEMFLYGLDKVFPLQFNDMTLARMTQPMSHKTPMGVLWDFMAASVGYTIFTGTVEVLGGLLLLIPQTVTLGALICVAAMTNVFALNLAYDIPVKRVSGHLLLLSVFLVVPSLSRLARFFVLNRATEPEPRPQLAQRRWVNRAATWVPVALCSVLAVIASVNGLRQLRHKRQAHALRSSFYGVWTFASLDLADPTRPMLTPTLMKSMKVEQPTDRWRKLIFEQPGTATIELGNGALDEVNVKEQAGAVVITDSGDPGWKCLLTLQKTNTGSLAMAGTVNGNPLHAELTREDETTFVLTKRRFHWVNEW